MTPDALFQSAHRTACHAAAGAGALPRVADAVAALAVPTLVGGTMSPSSSCGPRAPGGFAAGRGDVALFSTPPWRGRMGPLPPSTFSMGPGSSARQDQAHCLPADPPACLS
jgi:hypothetical protein